MGIVVGDQDGTIITSNRPPVCAIGRQITKSVFGEISIEGPGDRSIADWGQIARRRIALGTFRRLC